jgi:hypothetical protein
MKKEAESASSVRVETHRTAVCSSDNPVTLFLCLARDPILGGIRLGLCRDPDLWLAEIRGRTDLALVELREVLDVADESEGLMRLQRLEDLWSEHRHSGYAEPDWYRLPPEEEADVVELFRSDGDVLRQAGAALALLERRVRSGLSPTSRDEAGAEDCLAQALDGRFQLRGAAAEADTDTPLQLLDCRDGLSHRVLRSGEDPWQLAPEVGTATDPAGATPARAGGLSRRSTAVLATLLAAVLAGGGVLLLRRQQAAAPQISREERQQDGTAAEQATPSETADEGIDEGASDPSPPICTHTTGDGRQTYRCRAESPVEQNVPVPSDTPGISRSEAFLVLPVIWSDGERTAYALRPDRTGMAQGIGGGWYAIRWQEQRLDDGTRQLTVRSSSGAETRFPVPAALAAELPALQRGAPDAEAPEDPDPDPDPIR